MKFFCGLYEVEIKARDLILNAGEEEDTRAYLTHLGFIHLQAIGAMRKEGLDGLADLTYREFAQLRDASKKGGETDVQ